MDKPITASYKWTLDEYLRFYQEVQRRNKTLRNIKIKTIVFGLFLVAGGIIIVADRGFYSAAIFFLPVGVAMLALPWLTRHYTLKRFYKSPERNLVITWEIWPDRIRCWSELASSEFSWKIITKVSKTQLGFLLYKNGVLFNWVPLHAFSGVEAIERFSQLIQSRVQNYDQLPK